MLHKRNPESKKQLCFPLSLQVNLGESEIPERRRSAAHSLLALDRLHARPELELQVMAYVATSFIRHLKYCTCHLVTHLRSLKL